MKESPDIARVASLIGDPARANMLTALMAGIALTASELAQEAGVTAQTASSHLSKLKAGGLLMGRKQGRHQYYCLADADVADMLERLMGMATRVGHSRVRPGPTDPALRKARVCYDHLAGDLGVQMFDGLIQHRLIKSMADNLSLTSKGRTFIEAFGIDLEALTAKRRPVCKNCLDWSERRTHLAGGLGAALLNRFYSLKWAKRMPDSRVVVFSPSGLKKFETFLNAS